MLESDHGCTGVSAVWCPIHGDCTCPDREQAMDSDDCPLHSPYSFHAEEEPDEAFHTVWGKVL